MRASGIGGQAVMEGVMMRNGSKYAVAVRKPDKEIVVKVTETTKNRTKEAWKKVPIVRGVIAFVESLSVGMSTLSYSASFFDEETEKSSFEKKVDKVSNGHGDSILNFLMIMIAIMFAGGLFVILPTFLSTYFLKNIMSDTLLALCEGLIRLAIFLLYIALISLMKDIKRVFMYHGAEHKTINCIENGYELTVENVRKQSRQHRRCGTSFLLVVMVISIVFFMVIRVNAPGLRILLRILLIPIIAGVSYEFIRYAGRSNSWLAVILSKPGLWLQGLTTREPDDEMIEVAIASVEAVFDWKAFLEETKRLNERKRKERVEKTRKRLEKEEKELKKDVAKKSPKSEKLEIVEKADEKIDIDENVEKTSGDYEEASNEKIAEIPMADDKALCEKTENEVIDEKIGKSEAVFGEETVANPEDSDEKKTVAAKDEVLEALDRIFE